MPEDEQNFKYILLIGDIFSKYIEAVPVTDQSATQVIQVLYKKWILKYIVAHHLSYRTRDPT